MAKSSKEELEKEIKVIYDQVERYRKEDKVEELTYLAGTAMATLKIMGCPISDKWLARITKKVDAWANKPKKQEKKDG